MATIATIARLGSEVREAPTARHRESLINQLVGAVAVAVELGLVTSTEADDIVKDAAIRSLQVGGAVPAFRPVGPPAELGSPPEERPASLLKVVSANHGTLRIEPSIILEPLSLELYDNSVHLLCRLRSDPPAHALAESVRSLFRPAGLGLRVTDNYGDEYQPSGGVGGGGSSLEFYARVRLQPALSARASLVRLTIADQAVMVPI